VAQPLIVKVKCIIAQLSELLNNRDMSYHYLVWFRYDTYGRHLRSSFSISRQIPIM